MNFGKLVLGLVILAICGSAQESKPVAAASSDSTGSRQIRVTTTARLSPTGALVGNAKCDEAGNLYLRVMDEEASRTHRITSTLPLLRIAPDGTVAGTYDVTKVAADLRAIAFIVTGDGDVFMAARSDPEATVSVVAFTKAVPLGKQVSLESDFFVPYQIAVFPTGEFLLSGILGPENRSPYTGLYDQKGKLIRSIYEPEDEDARHRAESGEPGFRPSSIQFGNDFVTHGDVAIGSDGNAYLLRSSGLIYVISHSGQVLRKLRIESPEPGMLGSRIHSAPGRLAVVFLQHQSNQGVIEIVDYQGQNLGSHTTVDSGVYPGLMGCFDSTDFTFVAVDDNDRLQMLKAKHE